MVGGVSSLFSLSQFPHEKHYDPQKPKGKAAHFPECGAVHRTRERCAIPLKQPQHAPESTMIRKSQREKQRISPNAAQYIEPASAARFLRITPPAAQAPL